MEDGDSRDGGGDTGPRVPPAVTLELLTSTSYRPVADAPWDTSKPEVPFAVLAGVFAAIESTTKRLAINAALTSFFRSLIATAPAELLPAVYLCTCTLAPAYESLELGVGDSILMKALGEATGRQLKDLKADAEAKGDLGLVAETSRAKQRTLFGAVPKATAGGGSIRAMYAAFRGIALESGKASQEKKVSTIQRLLVGSTGVEARYVVRALQGKLRIGLAKASVLVSLAQAFALTPPLSPADAAAADVPMSQPAAAAAASAPTEAAPAAAAAAAAAADTTAAAAVDTAAAAADEHIVTAPPMPACLLTRRPKQARNIWSRGGGEVVLDYRRCLNEPEAEERLGAAVAMLKQVFSEAPSYDRLIPALLRGGIPAARAECSLTPGVAVSPMLAKPTKGVREVLARFEGVAFTCEYKYDGERAQAHLMSDGSVAIFSRNSENMTGKYPDLVAPLRDAAAAAAAVSSAASGGAGDDGSASGSSGGVRVTNAVLDGEVVAYDTEKGTLMPFQVLSTRARTDVTVESIKVQVIYVAFDLLYLNDTSLLHTPLATRRVLLRRHFHELPGRFTFAAAAESNDVEEINTFLGDAVKGGCEGLMVKVLHGADAVYTPSKRSLSWLKLKKDYMDGLTDSLDLVPIAAWRGKGKRTGTYGAYLLACYDPEDETYQAITKIGTGFSDDMLAELTAAFKDRAGCIVPHKPSNVLVGDALLDADVWFDPDASEVWEVKAADLSISAVHKAALGKVDSAKGIALRFPRFLRRRDDKGPADATSADQVADMYRSQSATVLATGDDDYDD